MGLLQILLYDRYNAKLFIFLTDIFPKLPFIVRIPNIVSDFIKTSFKNKGSYCNCQHEGGCSPEEKIVHCLGQRHYADIHWSTILFKSTE